jgi:hypothetical protein
MALEFAASPKYSPQSRRLIQSIYLGDSEQAMEKISRPTLFVPVALNQMTESADATLSALCDFLHS